MLPSEAASAAQPPRGGMEAWRRGREGVSWYTRTPPQPRAGPWHPGRHKRGRGGCEWAAKRGGAVDLLLGTCPTGRQVARGRGWVESLGGGVAVVAVKA